MIAFHIVIPDMKEDYLETRQELWLVPHEKVSELRIMTAKGNPPVDFEVTNVWIKNSDLKKAIKTLEDLA